MKKLLILIPLILGGMAFALTTNAITFVQEQGKNPSDGASGNLTITGVAAGDLLVVAFGYSNGPSLSTFTDSNGTPIFVASTSWHGTSRDFYYYEPNAASGSHKFSYTLSGTATYPSLNVMEYSGVATSSALDASSTISGSGSGSSIGGITVTSTVANDLIGVICSTAGDTVSAYSGFVLRANNNGQYEDNETSTGNVLGVAATSTYCTTQSAGVDWTVLSALFKPASTSTAPTSSPANTNVALTIKGTLKTGGTLVLK